MISESLRRGCAGCWNKADPEGVVLGSDAAVSFLLGLAFGRVVRGLRRACAAETARYCPSSGPCEFAVERSARDRTIRAQFHGAQ